MKEESIAFQIAFLAIQVGVILFAAGGPSTLSGICVRHGCSIVPPKGRIDRMKKSVSKDDVYNFMKKFLKKYWEDVIIYLFCVLMTVSGIATLMVL